MARMGTTSTAMYPTKSTRRLKVRTSMDSAIRPGVQETVGAVFYVSSGGTIRSLMRVRPLDVGARRPSIGDNLTTSASTPRRLAQRGRAAPTVSRDSPA
eukprot:6174363-Pleurochrysis_carterae.AAC.4